MMKKRSAIGKYDQEMDHYMNSDHIDNGSIAEEIIREANEKKISINQDKDILKHTMDLDIRDNIPPQMFSVVSGFIELIEKLERVDEDES